MTTRYVQAGKVLDFPNAGSAIASGDGVLVGAIRYLGNELIAEALNSGVLGIRTRVRVIAQQTVTHN